MKMQYALTQVCEVRLSRQEVEEMIRDNLKVRGGDPSYDFAVNHPIFVWDDRGDLIVRYVQGAVFAHETEKFRTLHPVPTRQEINMLAHERAAALRKATTA